MDLGNVGAYVIMAYLYSQVGRWEEGGGSRFWNTRDKNMSQALYVLISYLMFIFYSRFSKSKCKWHILRKGQKRQAHVRSAHPMMQEICITTLTWLRQLKSLNHPRALSLIVSSSRWGKACPSSLEQSQISCSWKGLRYWDWQETRKKWGWCLRIDVHVNGLF